MNERFRRPRVLTRIEAACKAEAWCEFRMGIEPQVFGREDISRWLVNPRYRYGVTWRCWSKKPSKRRMRKASWDTQ